MLIWLWNHKGGISFGCALALFIALAYWIRRRRLTVAGSSQLSAMAQQGAKILVLPACSVELPIKSVATALPRLGSDSIPTCLARFKLLSSGPGEQNHKLKASIEYIDSTFTDAHSGALETTVCRVNQAAWRSTQNKQSLELILALKVGGRLMALQDGQIEPGASSLFCGLFPINTMTEPLARVTLLDVDEGSKWQIDFRLQKSPLMATEVSSLTRLSD
jgi:hypothetical protein